MLLDAHADIDEKLAIRYPDEAYRYPQHGHVLYLFVGREVQAPTVITIIIIIIIIIIGERGSSSI
jgi:hypothetical protein